MIILFLFTDLDDEAFLTKSKYTQIMENKIKELKLDQVRNGPVEGTLVSTTVWPLYDCGFESHQHSQTLISCHH